jgi:hypothetical protein
MLFWQHRPAQTCSGQEASIAEVSRNHARAFVLPPGPSRLSRLQRGWGWYYLGWSIQLVWLANINIGRSATPFAGLAGKCPACGRRSSAGRRARLCRTAAMEAAMETAEFDSQAAGVLESRVTMEYQHHDA